MASRKITGRHLDTLPPLPLTKAHWTAISTAMQLSPRQAQIAEALARGAQFQEIADGLQITVPTVRTQLERIFNKTGARNRSELLLKILDVSHQVDPPGCHQF